MFDSGRCKLPPNKLLGLSVDWLGCYENSKNYFTFPLEGSPLSFQGKTLSASQLLSRNEERETEDCGKEDNGFP